MNDNDLMPSGRYQGEKLANVPAEYLLWLHENNRAPTGVRGYIYKNIDLLRAEAAKKKK